VTQCYESAREYVASLEEAIVVGRAQYASFTLITLHKYVASLEEATVIGRAQYSSFRLITFDPLQLRLRRS
jgi:hypothetical protein